MALQCEIIIEHEGPVSANVIRQSLDLIAGAAEEAARSAIGGNALRGVAQLPTSFLLLQQHAGRASLDAFWLETVEPGSSKFRGKIGGVMLAIIIAAAGEVTGQAGYDVLKETDFWQRLQPRMVELVNDFESAFVSNLALLSLKSDSRREIKISIDIVADRLRIRVLPSPRQSNPLWEDEL